MLEESKSVVYGYHCVFFFVSNRHAFEVRGISGFISYDFSGLVGRMSRQLLIVGSGTIKVTFMVMVSQTEDEGERLALRAGEPTNISKHKS